jgi:hypothetical protein
MGNGIPMAQRRHPRPIDPIAPELPWTATNAGAAGSATTTREAAALFRSRLRPSFERRLRRSVTRTSETFCLGPYSNSMRYWRGDMLPIDLNMPGGR